MTPIQNTHTLKLISDVGKLKRVQRTGWVRDGVKDAESVADHSYGVTFLAMTLAKKLKCNELKMIKMALVHDLGEAIVGDIVHGRGKKPNDKIRNNKINAEEKALKNMLLKTNYKEYYSLWQEYEKQTTKEAIILKQIDKIEMAMQAYEYEKETGLNLQEYFDYTQIHLTHPELIKIFEEIVKQRAKAKKN